MTMQYKPIPSSALLSWAKDSAAARTTVPSLSSCSAPRQSSATYGRCRYSCRLRARTLGSPLPFPPDPLGAVDERDRRRIGRARRRAKQAGVAGERSGGRRARWRRVSTAAAATCAPSPPNSGGARPQLRFGRRPCFARAPVSARRVVAYPLKNTREKGRKKI